MEEKLQAFASSIKKDRILAEYDILQSMAHARALENAGIINEKDKKEIISGLEKMLEEYRKDNTFFDGKYDDIHMAVEEKLGECGKKLHAGRSRNDQVACDMRMYVRDSIGKITGALGSVSKALSAKADKIQSRTIFMPACTHMQRAQAVDMATYLGLYVEWFNRDKERLNDLLKRVNIMPLGSAAGAGTNIKLDRNILAQELGFDGFALNPMDAVSSRDYILEFANTLSILGVHFSRMAEEFVIFSTKEFSFIELDESIADTSSIMPQKKNPDCFELVRSASARMISTAVNLALLMKGLPLTYNRDMQDDKEIFVSVETALAVTELLPVLIENISFNIEKLSSAASEGFIDAADFAEYLVLEKKIEFRTAHQLTGELVRKGIEKGYSMIGDFPLEELQEIVPEAGKDAFEFIKTENAVKRRLYEGIF
ncbi:MAG: argininosuccinate lyase [Elusimicrobiota bacterium]